MLHLTATTSVLALWTARAFADGHTGTMAYALPADGATPNVMDSIAAPA